MRSFRLAPRLSLLEVLVVVAGVGIGTILAVPSFRCEYPNPRFPLREAKANLIPLALGLERNARERGGAFAQREPTAPCAAVAAYRMGEVVPALGLRIQGELWSYAVQTIDADGDGRCEAFTITATGLRKPVLGKSLGIDARGKRFGDWK